jgi:hypothetical protein
VRFPNQDVRFNGEALVDGERIEVSAAPGCQTHLWGKKRKLYHWAHCNAFGEEGTSFEGLSVALRPGLVVNLYYLRHAGRVYGFNTGLRWTSAKSSPAFPEWRFSGRDGDTTLEGVARARAEQVLQVSYTDPDGEPFFCCNTELADLELRLRGPSGETVLRAEGTCALEFTSREERAGVRRWV